jgi:hypothetical protein
MTLSTKRLGAVPLIAFLTAALAGMLVFDPGGAAAAAAPWSDETGGIAGPSLGVLFDSQAGGLRRVMGIAGAATIGECFATAPSITQAWVSPFEDYALAETTAGTELMLLLLDASGVRVTPLGVAAGFDRVALSPTGASAVLYRRDRHVLQVVTGLPGAPAARAEVDISILPIALRSLAVSDDGLVLVGVLERERGAVYLVNREGTIGAAAAVGDAADIAFLRGSRDAVVADRRLDRVLLLRNLESAPETVTLAGAQEGIARPIGVSASEDGRRIFVVNRGAATITVIDSDQGGTRQLPCPAQPSGLFRLGRGDLFRLTDVSGEPLLVLDGSGDVPRVVFVPPPSAP